MLHVLAQLLGTVLHPAGIEPTPLGGTTSEIPVRHCFRYIKGRLQKAAVYNAQVPGDAEAALHRLQTKLLDVPAGARRPSREVRCIL